jgi:HEPN domain-containing protein
MTPTKLLIGQILMVFAIIATGLWASTQWAASMLAYQRELGHPWFRLGELPIYRPWSLFPWWFHYDAYARSVFNKAGALASASGFLGCAAAIAGSLWRARQSGAVTTYGSARWANESEVREAGLFEDDGVFLGSLDGSYLRHNGPEHVMAIAPTRSGKGVGLVVPTLLSWTGSVVIHDIKGENWALTSGWRSRFSHCLLFNPTDARSAHYNPLLEVRRGPEEVRDVQNIADILVDPEGALERRNHWEKTSHGLLVGAILHILYAEEEKTLARVATFLSDPRRSFAATLQVMMNTNHLGTKEAPVVHPVVASAARELLNKSGNERSGVLSTAMSFLGLYRDPTVAAVTSDCDWRIDDLVAAKRPVSLYLIDIISDGILLFEEPGHAFARPKLLTPAEALRESRDYFEEWFESAVEFFDDFRSNFERGRLKKAAFELHQATERFYHCLFLVRTLYSPKTHNLNQLRQLTEAMEPRLKEVWPRSTKFERRCYELLRDAYVKARYSREYRISEEQLAWLSERIELLQRIVRELCEARIAELATAA